RASGKISETWVSLRLRLTNEINLESGERSATGVFPRSSVCRLARFASGPRSHTRVISRSSSRSSARLARGLISVTRVHQLSDRFLRDFNPAKGARFETGIPYLNHSATSAVSLARGAISDAGIWLSHNTYKPERPASGDKSSTGNRTISSV